MHAVEMTGFVYRWRNTETDMLYIGSHGGTPDDGYIGSGVAFREAYDAAPDLFVREILYTGPEYRVVEDEWLVAYDAGRNPQFYNMGSRVNGTAEHTPETRAKMAASHRGVPLSADTRAKMSESQRNSPKAAAAGQARRGVPRSAETRAKIAEALRGVPLSAETRARMSEARRNSPKAAAAAEALRGVPLSPQTRAKMSEAQRNAPRATCPHCGKEGRVNNMSRWHFDNCPMKLDD